MKNGSVVVTGKLSAGTDAVGAAVMTAATGDTTAVIETTLVGAINTTIGTEMIEIGVGEETVRIVITTGIIKPSRRGIGPDRDHLTAIEVADIAENESLRTI